ncbi:MAG: HAD-IB family phosphatase [Nitrososphaera sp.]
MMDVDRRLAAFDMDGTLIQGRLVFALANKFGLTEKVKSIQSSGWPGHEQTRAIAALFSGLTEKDLANAIQSIPLTNNCEQAIIKLKERNYKIGIITDSYTYAAGLLADHLQLDFVAANRLEIEQGRITGRIEMPLGWEKIGCFCKISVCKRYHLEKFARDFDVPMENTLAVGDTRSDACMIRSAGAGVVFMPKDDDISRASTRIVREPDLLGVLEHA